MPLFDLIGSTPAPSKAYRPTSPGGPDAMSPARSSSSAQILPKQPPNMSDTVKRPLGMNAPYVSAANT